MANSISLKPKSGRLLIAQPSLDDPHFNHAVVYLLDYKEGEETLGLVLNRSTPLTLDKAIDGISSASEIPIYSGGPVGTDRLLYVHNLGGVFHDAREISQGLFVGGELDEVLEYINNGYPTLGALRFFVGYSGWSPGQLEAEIDDGAWVVADVLSSDLMLSMHDNQLWHAAVRTLGDKYNEWRYSPMYPHLN